MLYKPNYKGARCVILYCPISLHYALKLVYITPRCGVTKHTTPPSRGSPQPDKIILQWITQDMEFEKREHV